MIVRIMVIYYIVSYAKTKLFYTLNPHLQKMAQKHNNNIAFVSFKMIDRIFHVKKAEIVSRVSRVNHFV